MFSPQQALEFFRFEQRLLLRHPTFWLSLFACIAAGVAFAAADIDPLQVAAGRVNRNVPYAVVRLLTGLSALGMIVVMISVAQAALRDFSTGAAPLIFSRPVRPSSYLVGRLAGGYCMALVAVLAGAVAMAVTLVMLEGRDPAIEPLSWFAWIYGVVVFVLPNMLLVGSLIFLLALWSRSIGATFLGLLAIIIGQDIAEALPVSTFGTRLPALLDPLGLAALNSATSSWTVSQFASSLPSLRGDLLLNRAIWGALTLLFCGLAGAVFSLRARRADAGRRPKHQPAEHEARPSTVTLGLPSVQPSRGARVQRLQFWAILRFELRRMVSSLAFKVIVASGLAMLIFGVLLGERILDVKSVPGSRTIALALARAAKLTMTLLVVLFSGALVWRERSTRMALTLDALPTAKRVTVAGKFAALAVLITGTLTLYGGTAWALQTGLAGHAAQSSHVAAAVAHESLVYLQLAAFALLLQTLVGGRMAGYLAVGLFLALRLVLRPMGYTSDMYSLAAVRLPLMSDMDGWSHVWRRIVLVHAYWTCVAATLAILAGLLWPRGEALTLWPRLARAFRRLRKGALAGLAVTLASSVLLGAWLYRATEAPGTAWHREQVESFQIDYELDYGEWRGRPRPEVVSMQADVDLHATERRVRIRGRYGLRNRHPQAIERMLFSHEPDHELHGLGFSEPEEGAGRELGAWIAELDSLERPFVEGVLAEPGSGPGTHVLRFDPPLAPGASIQLDFDLEFDPAGLGSRPGDVWVRENGSFLLAGTGTHSFFVGAHFFPTLGYDAAREVRRTRARKRRGLDPWTDSIAPEEYEQRSARAGDDVGRTEAYAGADFAQVELWIHTDEDQTPLAPGELVGRNLAGGRVHSHFRSRGPIQAFFPIVCGRYELVSAQQGDVKLELYYHAEHEERVAHILWALQRSLAYFEEHWGPYPQRVLRLGEIPGGNTFACSFPGVMAFAEGMAFTCPRGDGQAIEFPAADSADASSTDLDPILWIVAHEVAHQWWDCHVIPAQALGASLVSESLAQYGSLCVIEQEYGAEVALRMAEYGRKRYLIGRSRSDRAEHPLVTVDEQDHLHYQKGLVAFHALAKLAGYAAIDRVLAGIIADYGGAQGKPLTSIAFLSRLTNGLPPELGPNVEELFERIDFLESSVSSAETRAGPAGGHELVVECSARGLRADGDGAEHAFDYSGPLELEVLFEGEGSPALLEATVAAGRARFVQRFEQKPTHVRVDPRLLHIDRELADNELPVVETHP